MTTLQTHVDQPLLSPDELADLLRAYQEATDRLQAAHGELQREVARLRQELAAKNAELARKSRLAALGEMAAGVAHEIRNPLGAIRLFIGMLQRELAKPAGTGIPRPGTPPARGRSGQAAPPKSASQPAPVAPADRLLTYTQTIVRAVSSMDRIVGDMLSLARTREPTLLPCDLGSVIDQALEAAAQELAQRRTVVERGQIGPQSVLADTDQLSRALLNIILNAAQAMERGGRLRLAVAPAGDRLRVHFTDSGPGIDPDDLERIFEPFFTGRDGGTGLGLALVHRIVEGHQGRVWARNEPAGGATFTVELPSARGAPGGARNRKDQGHDGE